MSTITDALKKLQTNLEQKKIAPELPPSKPDQDIPFIPQAQAAKTSILDSAHPRQVPPLAQESMPLRNENLSTITAPQKSATRTKKPALTKPPVNSKSSMKRKSLSLPLVFGILCLLPMTLIIFLVPLLLRKSLPSVAPRSQTVTARKQARPPVVFPTPKIKSSRPDLPSSPSMAQKITLKGIMITNGKTVAFINDDIYEAGEKIDNMEIINISMDAVQLRKGEEIITVKAKK